MFIISSIFVIAANITAVFDLQLHKTLLGTCSYVTCEISGSKGGEYKCYSLLGYSAVWFRPSRPALERSVLPPSSPWQRTSQTSVCFNDTTRCYIPEGCIILLVSLLTRAQVDLEHEAGNVDAGLWELEVNHSTITCGKAESVVIVAKITSKDTSRKKTCPHSVYNNPLPIFLEFLSKTGSPFTCFVTVEYFGLHPWTNLILL
jgi:hypothetical protein